MIPFSEFRKLHFDDQFNFLKQETEKFWSTIEICSNIYGFQIQKGTKWLPGLSDDEINNYEHEMGFEFPNIYKTYLKHMNGTDKPTINIFGNSGEPYSYSVGYYPFPRDIERVKGMIEWIYESFKVDKVFVENNMIPHIMPIEAHSFLIIDNCSYTPVLSMYGDDVVLYASNLASFIYNDIFYFHKREENINYEIKIKQLFKFE